MNSLGRGASVMVIDTGFDAATPFVFPQEIKSFTHDPTTGSHDGHGNMVSSIIASQDPLKAGIAPAATLYVAKALSSHQHWGYLNRALDWALELQVDVVNMSFSIDRTDPGLEERLARLDASGAICVASHHPGRPWPHLLPYVVSAGLTDVPGVDMIAGDSQGMHVRDRTGRPFTGTSVSCAVVSGIAACAKAWARNFAHPMDRSMFVEQLRSRIAGGH